MKFFRCILVTTQCWRSAALTVTIGEAVQPNHLSANYQSSCQRACKSINISKSDWLFIGLNTAALSVGLVSFQTHKPCQGQPLQVRNEKWMTRHLVILDFQVSFDQVWSSAYFQSKHFCQETDSYKGVRCIFYSSQGSYMFPLYSSLSFLCNNVCYYLIFLWVISQPPTCYSRTSLCMLMELKLC